MTSEFWHDEIQRLADTLVKRCLTDRERVQLRDIADQGFPEIFTCMAKSHARKLFALERPFQLAQSDRYDFESTAFRRIADEFMEEVLAETVFHLAELQELANKSVEFQIDVLVRPRQKFLQVLFQEQEQFGRDDALTVIRGFGEKRAFVERIVAILKSKEEPNLLKLDMSSLARKAEMAVYKETPVSTFLNEILLYLEFETEVTGEAQTLLSSQILLEMLKERELDDVFEDLGQEAQEKDSWTVTEIESALERHLLVGILEQRSASGGETDSFVAGGLDLGGLHLPKRPRAPHKKKKHEFDSLQFSFLDDEHVGTEEPTGKHEEEILEHFSEPVSKPGNGESEPDQIETRNEEPENEPWLMAIDAADREFILKTVFKGDDKGFSAFLGRVKKMQTWLEAKAAIDDELVRRRIDTQAEAGVRLGDVVFVSFFRGNRWPRE
ncbi:MAG: hypothetical protein ACE5IY_06080 [bacterium]